jgi:eukaryotic-like serine/threonine-protein kinase
VTELRDRLQEALGDAYEVVRELGGGGMSHVFLAVERQLDRQVVIKLLPPDLAGGVSLDRFRREIQLVARLQHPHIVPVLAAGEATGVPFFTMPFVAGRSLRDMLRSGTSVPIPEAIHILREVAVALVYAHAQGIVHRDIKPDNVLLSGGSAMVTDFGVAKAVSASRQRETPAGGTLTLLGTSLGTPAYMAPEQTAGDPATDHRADIYSFGAMAFELITGSPPFAGRAPAALLAAQMTEVPPAISDSRPESPDPLVDLVTQCLEKDPAARPQSASEIVQALDQALAMAVEPAITTRSHRAAPVAVAPPVASRRIQPLLIAAGVVAIAAIGAFVALRSRDGAPAEPSGQRSIAVLPLEIVGGGEDDRYFSEGMTDELSSALSKVPGLRVASRTSVFALRSKGMPVDEIAKTLRVSNVLEGTVRRAGDRLRVSAQLTNASDGLSIWSEVYERQMRDVFQVQDDIASSIANALRVTLAPRAAPNPSGTQQGTSDLAAYDLYLRGRYFFHQRGSDALRRAADYFEQAIARDPNFARAHAGVADALGLLPIYGTTPADSAFPLARKAAERALALDSTLAEAHTTLGLILKSTGEWEPSAVAFRKSLSLDSTYATTHQWLAETYLITGRLEEAVAELRRARDLEPLSAIVNAELGYSLGMLGQYDEAIAAGQRAIELDSTLWTGHAFLGFVHLFKGDARPAAQRLEAAVRLGQGIDPLVGALAHAHAKAGDPARARALLPPIEARAARPGGSPVALAMAYTGLGELDRALSWLERGARERDPWLYAMSINAPVYAALWSDPRFADIARIMKLDPAAMTRAGSVVSERRQNVNP